MTNTRINWSELKRTPDDGEVKCHKACGGMEYRHNPQTTMHAESVEVHDGHEAIRVLRYGQGWSTPHRVNW